MCKYNQLLKANMPQEQNTITLLPFSSREQNSIISFKFFSCLVVRAILLYLLFLHNKEQKINLKKFKA